MYWFFCQIYSTQIQQVFEALYFTRNPVIETTLISLHTNISWTLVCSINWHAWNQRATVLYATTRAQTNSLQLSSTRFSWGLNMTSVNTLARTTHFLQRSVMSVSKKKRSVMSCHFASISEEPSAGSVDLPRLRELIATPGRQRQARWRWARRRPP
jgi:hypothetical protein